MYNEGKILVKGNPELVSFWNNKSPNSKARLLNALTLNNWLERLKLMAVSIFEWENLPDGITSEWIESELFENGKLAFFKTDDNTIPINTHLVLPFSDTGVQNIYGQPTEIIAKGKTSTTFNVQADEFVEIKANKSALPLIETAILYAQRIANVERSIDVNIQNQKFPFLIKGTEDQKLALINFMNKFDNNEPYFIVDENFLDNTTFDVFNTNAPFVADKLMTQKHDIINEWLTFLGLSNANTDKKERLIVDEVNANNEEVKLALSSGLEARQTACEEINQKFGLNISVKEINMTIADFGYIEEFSGDVEDEPIYDRD